MQTVTRCSCRLPKGTYTNECPAAMNQRTRLGGGRCRRKVGKCPINRKLVNPEPGVVLLVHESTLAVDDPTCCDSLYKRFVQTRALDSNTQFSWLLFATRGRALGSSAPPCCRYPQNSRSSLKLPCGARYFESASPRSTTLVRPTRWRGAGNVGSVTYLVA